MDDVYDFDEFYGENYADLEAHLYGLIHHRETSALVFSTLNNSIAPTNKPQEHDCTSLVESLNSEIINKEIPLEVTNDDHSNDQQECSNESENSPSDAVKDEIETVVTHCNTPGVNLIESGESDDDDILFIPTEIVSPILIELESPLKHEQSNSEADKSVSKYTSIKKKNTSLNNKRFNDFIVIDSTSESDDDDEVMIIEPPPIIPICIDSSEELEPEVEVKEPENISKIAEEINVVNLNTSFISPDLPSTSASQLSGSSHRGTKCPSPSLSTFSDDFIQNDCEKLNITENNSSNFNFSLLHLDDDNSSNTFINSSFSKSILTNSVANKSNEFLQSKPFEFSSQSGRNFSSSITSTPLPKNNSKNIYSSDEDNNSNRANDCFATPNRKTKRSVNMKTYAIGANFSGRAVDLYESESSDLPESICEVPIRKTPISKPNDKVSTTQDNLKVHNLSVQAPNSRKSNSLDYVGIIPKTPISKPNDNVSTTQDNLNVHNLSVQAPKSRKSSSLDYLGINMNEVHKNSMIRRYAKYWSSINSFYDKSWGGEHFSHSKIISKMIGGRQNWSVSYNDINPSSVRKNRNCKLRCHNCQQLGHILSTCTEPIKPIVCYSCGIAGHREPRCPAKLCLCCGSPSNFQVAGCSKCRQYARKICSICKFYGHVKDNCPDLWRRYHLSTDHTKPLTEAADMMKDQTQIYCCNCGRKGHHYYQCEVLRFSEHTPTGDDIVSYKPMYPIEKVNFQISFKNDSNNLSNSHGRSVEYKNTQMGKLLNVSSKLELNSNESLEALHLKRKSTQIASGLLKKQKNAELCISHSSEFQVKNLENKPDNNLNAPHDVQDTSNRNKSQYEVPMKFCNNDYKNSPAKINIDKTTTPAWLPEYISFNNNESLSTPNDPSLAATSSSNNPEKEITNKIYLSKSDASKLLESDGSQFLLEQANKNEILIEMKKSVDGQINFMVLDGQIDKQLNFRMLLENWLRIPRTVAFKEDLVVKCPPVIIPQKKLAIKSLLKLEIDQLDTNLGNPCAIYQFIKSFEKKHYSTKKLKKRYYKECKDLNMILFGQLGYREGKTHLNWLKDFLKTSDSTRVSVEKRKDLINHFKYIFSSIKHENYEEIINEYKNRNVMVVKDAYNKITEVKLPLPKIRLKTNNEVKDLTKTESSEFKNRNMMVVKDADNKITEVKLPLPAKIRLKPNNEVKDLTKTESTTSVVELRNPKRLNTVIVGDKNILKNSVNFIQDGLNLLEISNSQQFSDTRRNHFKMLRTKINLNTFNYGDYRKLKMYYKDVKYRSKRQS